MTEAATTSAHKHGDETTYFGPMFRDRAEAGTLLAGPLRKFAGPDTLVIGIPRGGVVVAAEVARRLGADLDIVLARKVAAPNSPELTIGAVTAIGARCFNDAVIRELGLPDGYIQAAVAEAMADVARQEKGLRDHYARANVQDRTVIVVDDGLSSGASMCAVVRALRKGRPARVVVAVPIGSPEACAALREEADEFVCLHEPATFWTVGLGYRAFPPVPEDEVRRIVHAFQALRHRPPEPAAG
jgi:putative phosphoribosyl transferase